MDYKDASLPIQERVQDLLGRMTTAEKIGQLIQPMGWKTYDKAADGTVQVTEEFKADMEQGGVGSLYGVLRADPWTEVTLEMGLTPRQGAVATNVIQQYAMEHSRLGIPILFGEKCSHGHMAIGNSFSGTVNGGKYVEYGAVPQDLEDCCGDPEPGGNGNVFPGA